LRAVWFTNCWEKDYRVVLRPEFLAGKLCMYDSQFHSKFVTINNVRDVRLAIAMAKHCVDIGVIDEYFVVREHEEEAFRQLAIDSSAVRRVINFTNWMAVAIAMSKCEYLVHCAADVTFTGNRSWVTDATTLIESNRNVVMVTPKSGDWHEVEREQSVSDNGAFWLHPGITDTCFVLDRQYASQPIYNIPVSENSHFPLSTFGACWEERLDAYVRYMGHYRAIVTDVTWKHWGNLGESYPSRGLLERVLHRINLKS
jgi:hypothetical protein